LVARRACLAELLQYSLAGDRDTPAPPKRTLAEDAALTVSCIGVGVTFMLASSYVLRVPADTAQSTSSSSVAGAQLSLICRFSAGRLRGQTVDFSGVPNVIPAVVGTPCRDSLGSIGITMPPGTAAVPLPLSSVCQFTFSPKSGGWHDFTPLPPAEVGTQCTDGQGSVGVLVAHGMGPPK
jgi:hypothetical protein